MNVIEEPHTCDDLCCAVYSVSNGAMLCGMCSPSGPTLVLIPGLLCDERLWSSQIAAVASVADVHVPDITNESSIVRMAEAVLASVPARLSLVGFSLGGQVALAIMELAPERIDRLALVSTTHGGLIPPVELALTRAVSILASGDFDGYLQSALSTYLTPAHAMDALIRTTFFEMAYAVGVEAGIRQMRALLAIKSPFRNLNRICCPVVVVGGRDDGRTTPEAHRILTSEIPRAVLNIIPDCAHFVPLEQPALLNQTLYRWITEPQYGGAVRPAARARRA